MKPIHVFDFNGTLVGKELGYMFERYARGNVFVPLFEPLLTMSDEEWSERFPEAATKGMSPKDVHDRLLDIIANPPKFTKARAAYYLILEGEMRAGKIDVGLAPDAIRSDGVLARLKKAGTATALLSRGTADLLEATLAGLNMRSSFDVVESTIPYGNTKTKEMYLGFKVALKKNGYELVAYYDDEPGPISQAYLAGKEIEKETGIYPFRLFWINRDELPPDALISLLPEEGQEDMNKHIFTYPNLIFDPF